MTGIRFRRKVTLNAFVSRFHFSFVVLYKWMEIKFYTSPKGTRKTYCYQELGQNGLSKQLLEQVFWSLSCNSNLDLCMRRVINRIKGLKSKIRV